MTCPICHRHLVHWHWAGTDRCMCSWEDQKAAWEKQAEFKPILLEGSHHYREKKGEKKS